MPDAASPVPIWRTWLRSETRLLFVLTLAVGILSGLAAVAFHRSIDVVDALLLAPATAHTMAGRALRLAPLLGISGLVVGVLLQYVFPFARGSGIPEVKYEYSTTAGPRLTARTVAGKFILGVLAIGSGFSLGREGPTVQICAGIGAGVAKLTRQGSRVARSLICIGAAAGIAAAFNTPIAAITFALEEIVGDLNQRLLGAIVVATVAAAVVEHAILGGRPVFNVPAYALGRWWELIAYALLGVIAAGAATLFVKGTLWMRGAVRGWTGIPGWSKPAVGGLLVAAIGIPAPAVLGIGYATLSTALLGQRSLLDMAALGGLKLAATMISYAWGLAGGIFAPALYVGGMLGGAVGAALHYAVPDNPTIVGSFALVGMGAFFAGAIRAPITSILMIFEMTGDYAIILPLMIANVISYTLCVRWQPMPIYDALLAQDGLNVEGHEATAFKRIPIERIMTRTVVTAGPQEPTAAALERAREINANALPVVDAAGRLVGIVSRKDLAQPLVAQALVDAAMTRRVATVFADQTVESALVKMGRLGVRQVPVVRRAEPDRLVGIVALRDISARGRNPEA